MVTKAKPKTGWQSGGSVARVIKNTDPVVQQLRTQLVDLWASEAGRELRAVDDDETRFETDAALRRLGAFVPDRRRSADLERQMVAAVNSVLGSHHLVVDDLRNAPRPTHVAAAVQEVVDAAEWVRASSTELLRAVHLSHDQAQRDKRVGLAAVVRNLDEVTRKQIREALEAADVEAANRVREKAKRALEDAGVDPAGVTDALLSLRALPVSSTSILDEDFLVRAVDGFAKLAAALDIAIPHIKGLAVPRKQSRGRPRTTAAIQRTVSRLEDVFAHYDGGGPEDRDDRRRRFVKIALGVIDLERPVR